MKIRQWIGFFTAMAGGSSITKSNGIEYLIASIMVLIVGILLWSIPGKKQ